ncbi:MAG: hypothetical protein Q4C56_00540 [Peptococcaceae bacterium]|nr:hypothetical protein [Peptococcaceae bacterium]
MVRNRTLLLLASIVWLMAGFNIVRIGFGAYADYLSVFDIGCSLVIFVLFWQMFSKLVNKHTRRISSMDDEKQYFWRFFDLKSFCIMAIMMGGGITIRTAHLLPDVCIAVFYSGLGVALFLAGVKFAVKYVRQGAEA